MKVRTKTMIAFMLPNDNDFHMDKEGNLLVFDRLDELFTFLTENNLPVDKVSCFEVTAIEEEEKEKKDK